MLTLPSTIRNVQTVWVEKAATGCALRLLVVMDKKAAALFGAVCSDHFEGARIYAVARSKKEHA